MTEWSEWTRKVGASIIKDTELKIGIETVYNSAEDPDKEEKLRLLMKIDELEHQGFTCRPPVYLNSSLNEIRYAYTRLVHLQSEREKQLEKQKQMSTPTPS